ncbi:unnamed protein product [Schistocephalus solidus]|uniref:Uncharacterized protein n=1 Tax=Schistocephalus solidus TaxID=70667 RepID=A0A183SW35_SCHSO|nr:unnamed protein product [Schistocephalus solidus]
MKQGCILVSTLCRLMFSVMLMGTHRDKRPGIRITYRMDGKLINQCGMHSQSRVSTATIHKLLFSNDCGLNASCDNFELRSHTDKMAVMHQTLPNTNQNAPRIHVNGAQLKAMYTLTYLGKNISLSTNVNDEVAHRIAKASQAFGRMQNVV